MTFIAVYVLIVLSILFLWHRLLGRNKKVGNSEVQLEVELLRKARMMFPGLSDIVALDALYQHTFRSMLVAQKVGDKNWEDLKRASIAIYNAKNRAIIEAVRFEERYITPHASGHTVIPFQRS